LNFWWLPPTHLVNLFSLASRMSLAANLRLLRVSQSRLGLRSSSCPSPSHRASPEAGSVSCASPVYSVGSTSKRSSLKLQGVRLADLLLAKSAAHDACRVSDRKRRLPTPSQAAGPAPEVDCSALSPRIATDSPRQPVLGFSSEVRYGQSKRGQHVEMLFWQYVSFRYYRGPQCYLAVGALPEVHQPSGSCSSARLFPPTWLRLGAWPA